MTIEPFENLQEVYKAGLPFSKAILNPHKGLQLPMFLLSINLIHIKIVIP